MAPLTPSLAASRRLVVKIGSALLVDRATGLRAGWLRSLAEDVARLRAHGTLAWREGRNGGIQFDEPIDVAKWAPGSPGNGHRDVERMVALSRGQVAPQPPWRIAALQEKA